MDNLSTFFFPLRTNVEFFKSGENYLDLKSRAKEALLLYDRIVFQAGVYRCFVGPKGRMEQIQPFDKNRDRDELEEKDTSKEFFVQVRPTGATPETPFTRLIDSPLERAFRAQFHTLADEITSGGIEEISLEWFELPQPMQSLARDMANQDKESIKFPQHVSKSLEEVVVNNLNIDLLLIALLGHVSVMDSLHSPLLSQKVAKDVKADDASGFLSLEVFVPNVSSLAWDEIRDIRKELSLIEFRKRLVAAENIAREMLGNTTTEEISHTINSILIEDLLEEIKMRMPTVGKSAIDVGVELIGNVIAPVGIAKSILGMSGEIKELLDQRRSWITTFMRLRKR
jgi:hypothetical protein